MSGVVLIVTNVPPGEKTKTNTHLQNASLRAPDNENLLRGVNGVRLVSASHFSCELRQRTRVLLRLVHLFFCK